jgi:acyl-ACP thioesterase
VLDFDSRKPKRIDKLIRGIESFSTRQALERDPEKLDKVFFQSNPPQRTASYSEIDVNGHVNNARYIGWIMDSYSFDFHRAHSIQSIEVNYLGETVCGEMVSISSEQTAPEECWHSIVKSGTRMEVFRAKVNWTLAQMPAKMEIAS